MSTKVLVNMKTTVHKKSSGMAPCFPDTCKTPTPAGPTPIPYPNMSRSSMSSATTNKVKTDKKGCSVKGSKFSISCGDEAGTAGGSLISNKIKGVSYFKNFSFDVKMEKKKVARLADPKLCNCSSAGWLQPGEVQPSTMVAAGGDEEACAKLKRLEPPDAQDKIEEHGVDHEHAKAMSEAAEATGKSFTVRQGNKDCLGKIRDGFPGKPGSVTEGDSLSPSMPKKGANGRTMWTKDANGEPVTVKQKVDMPEECVGLVGSVDDNGRLTQIQTANGPIRRDELDRMRESDPGNFENNLKKRGAYTGDYDLHDTFDGRGRIHDQSQPNGTPKPKWNSEENLRVSINESIARRDPNRSNKKLDQMVLHGGQANYPEYCESTGKRKGFSAEKSERLFKSDLQRKPKSKPLIHFDKNGEAYAIETEDDLKNLYACKGGKMPKEWGLDG
jgi:hypothetical protein